MKGVGGYNGWRWIFILVSAISFFAKKRKHMANTIGIIRRVC